MWLEEEFVVVVVTNTSNSGNIYQSFNIYSVRLRAYHVFHGLFLLILTTPLESRYCQYSYFTEEELFRETT